MARTKPLQDPEYRAFVGRLTVAREQARLTQVEAATRLGRPQSYVAKCENLYRRIDIVELAALLRLYGLEANVFFAPWTDDERRAFGVRD